MKAELTRAPERSRTIVDAAKTRLLSEKGDPLAIVDWRALFLNFVISPNILRGQIPPCFDLELHEGNACVSLVALTKRNFRRHANAPWYGAPLSFLREQRFLNLRVYVRHRGEPGVLFLWGWLSRPWNLPLPDEPIGLTCAFADIDYSHAPLRGTVTGKGGTFAFSGIADTTSYEACVPGSLAELAMERYSGFFWHRGAGRVFRAWHEPWQSVAAHVNLEDTALITHRFPWFAEAQFVEARLCADCPNVWLGRAHRLERSRSHTHHGTTAFFDLP